MKFNFFASTGPQSLLAAGTATAPTTVLIATEHAALSQALYTLLESLPQAPAERDHIHRLCDTVLDATPRLRLIWIGFAADDELFVAPHAVAGESIVEANDWRLPLACFDAATPYAQAALETTDGSHELHSLFAPWLGNMDACSAHAALAIPLRSEKREVGEARGLIVFYSDDVNYFSRLGGTTFQAIGHVAEIIWRQTSLMQMLAHKSQIDALTGLMNRRKMHYVLKAAIERAQREEEMLSIMILRIDRFGRLNERFGWNAGDNLLTSFANEVALQMRAQDRLARWTGVEFLYLMPRTDRRHAEFLAHGLRAYFSSHPLRVRDEEVALDLHIGVATCASPTMQLDELLREADCQMQVAISASRA
ncbi:MAG: GGDEF domain-containing protein [Proteobacteria bacterium]|nr:GGDEF domain-containing protein [Pseudomonadota bacterium]